MKVQNEAAQADAKDALSLIETERALRSLGPGQDFREARTILRTYLFDRAGAPPSGSSVDAIELLAKSPVRMPDVAAVLLRALAVQHFLPSGGPGSQLDRCLVSIVELGLPKVCELLGLNQKSQTFEKTSKLRGAHARVCELLAPLAFEYGSLEGIVGARQPIIAALNQ